MAHAGAHQSLGPSSAAGGLCGCATACTATPHIVAHSRSVESDGYTPCNRTHDGVCMELGRAAPGPRGWWEQGSLPSTSGHDTARSCRPLPAAHLGCAHAAAAGVRRRVGAVATHRAGGVPPLLQALTVELVVAHLRVHRSQLTAHSSQLTLSQLAVNSSQIHRSHFTARRFTVHSSQFTVHTSPLIVHRSSFTARTSQLTAFSSQFTVHSLLFTVHTWQRTMELS